MKRSIGLEMLIETEMVSEERLQGLIQEANELLSIVVTAINTSKKNS